MNGAGWTKLVEITDSGIGRATRFLVKDSGVYEPLVELFLVENPDSPSRFSFYVSTGHKAGCILVSLPSEAKTPGELSISKSWLIENWRKWVIDTDPAEVLCKKRYEPGE